MENKTKITLCLLLATSIATAVSCKKETSAGQATPGSGAPQLPAAPYDYVNAAAGMPAYLRAYLTANPGVDNTPAGNPITNDGATLGRVLFYDKSLSRNNTIACASCHHQDKAFVDGTVFSKGFEGNLTRRNAMPLANMRYFREKKMFWDLRAATLEDQVLQPVVDHIEMGMPSIPALVEKLNARTYYPPLFKKAFGTESITETRIANALAQFIRSIVSFGSKYDQGLDNNLNNLSAQEKAGLKMLHSLACTECHSDLSTAGLGSTKFPTFFLVENAGLNTGFGANNALDETYADNGIGEKTGKAEDMGTFKMPSLRNIELTAPYMHDGRFSTLEEVLEHYRSGAKTHANRGIQIPNGGYRAAMTDDDKANIIAFLKTLTDRSLTSDPRYADPFK